MASCKAAKRRASRQKAASDVVQIAPICKLPANIMLHVFGFLDVRTLCVLSTVCRTWYHLVCDRFLWKFVDLRPWSLSLRTLKKLVRNRLSDSVFELLVKGFIGTTKKNENISPSLLEEIKTKCTNLETLGLCYCDMRNVPVQCLPPNLRSLLLDHSIVPLGWFEGLQFEMYFPDLEKLNLTYCTRIENSDLKSITKLKTLRNLNLSYCYRVGDEGIQHIACNLSKLTALDVSNCPNITDLGLHHIGRHLTGLKTLNLLSNWRITDDGVLSLVHSLEELQDLNLSCCKEVTNVGLSEIMERCKKLRILNIIGCASISERDVSEARLSLSCCNIQWP
ncbi:F-box/LRR-repeat protein 20-like [Montipora foliosa]|uniref:F-box/LRR-repeat protein 20-like n=1 Tax=Montipora foliosa TaxID=591990 RepID=UPI0035F1890E